MAEDKIEPREVNLAHWLPWTVLFRGFQVALDLKKLLLAAAGILTMAFGWWLLAIIFYGIHPVPDWGSGKYDAKDTNDLKEVAQQRDAFKQARQSWNLFYAAAGPEPLWPDANDLADTKEEFEQKAQMLNKIEGKERGFKEIQKKLEAAVRAGEAGQLAQAERKEPDPALDEVIKLGEVARQVLQHPKPYGRLRTWPWFEERGPNPYLLVTGQAGTATADGTVRSVPWERGHFMDWLLGEQVPVLIEPLVKFLRPLAFLLNPHASLLDVCYFLLVLLWTLATWAFFGGAITRMAAVQVARNEKIGLGEAVRFVWSKKLSYLFASVAPFVFIGAITVLLALFGLVNLVGLLGDIWDGLLWPLVLLGGLAMAVGLVGLVGWPMMHATLSAEGSDSFDAISRSYSYVFQGPWHYAWYAFVALVYGAVVVFFVGFMGSLMVYLGKSAVGLTPGSNKLDRNPSYLFVNAPTSFGWRELLLQGTTVGGRPLVVNGVVDEEVRQQYLTKFSWWNYIGMFLVSVWTYLFFLMIVGFGYSYFWSVSTITYLLMRRKVDDTELDEVYLEEEEPEDTYTTSMATTPAPSAPATPGLQMVDAPALRPSTPPAPGPAPVGTTSPSLAATGESGIKPAPAATPAGEIRDAPEPPPGPPS